jgi:hypothetical protein
MAVRRASRTPKSASDFFPPDEDDEDDEDHGVMDYLFL